MRKLKNVEKDLQKKLKKDAAFRETYEIEELKAQIALFVIQTRMKQHLTQAQLAKKAEIKQQEVSRIENGDIGTFRMLYKVLHALGRGVKILFPKEESYTVQRT